MDHHGGIEILSVTVYEMVVNILANIILKEYYSINAAKINYNDTYDLSELFFYIPNKFNNSYIFILITDSTINDIIPLQYDSICHSYKIYRVKYDNQIRVKSGKLKIRILVFNDKEMDISMSKESIEINCTVENYKLAHQLAITMEINSALTETYNKIVELTNMNISIYEKISEVCKS